MKTITYDETKWKLMPLKATSAMVDVLEFGRKQPTHNTYLNLLAVAPTPPTAAQTQPDADKVDAAFDPVSVDAARAVQGRQP